jgi:dethiobiotin synthetase
MMLASICGTISMARRFLITGTGPRVGKTTVGCALGFAMRARGMSVGVMKPVDTPHSQDAEALALAVGSILPIDVVCPYRFSSAIARGQIDRAHLARCFRQIATQSDVVLIEAASTIDFTDLAAMLDAEIILVVGNRPGCVDAMTQALQHCERRGLTVASCILCDCEPAPHVETLEPPAGVAYLGRMRHREPLAKAIVEKII